MHLDRGQPFELISHILSAYLHCFIEGLSLCNFGNHTARCDCRTTPERLKLDILDLAVIGDFDVDVHQIPAYRVSDPSHGNTLAFEGTDIPRILEVIQHLQCILCALWHYIPTSVFVSGDMSRSRFTIPGSASTNVSTSASLVNRPIVISNDPCASSCNNPSDIKV